MNSNLFGITTLVCLFRNFYFLLKLVEGQPVARPPNLFHPGSIKPFGVAFGER